MMLPPIMIGMISRLMMNVLVRTAAVYSREAMTQILRMMRSQNGGLGDVLVRRRDADKDVVQRRLRQLEVQHPAAADQRAEHALRIPAALQAQLLQPAEVRHLGHPRQTREVGM